MKNILIIFLIIFLFLSGCTNNIKYKNEDYKNPIDILVTTENTEIKCSKYISKWDGYNNINEEDYLVLIENETKKIKQNKVPTLEKNEILNICIDNMPQDVDIERMTIFNDYKKIYARKVDKTISKNCITFKNSYNENEPTPEGYIYTVILTWEEGVCRYVFSSKTK